MHLSNQFRFIHTSYASNSTIFVLFNLPSKDHHNITKILLNIYHYPQHMSFQPQHINIYLSNQFRFIHTSYASNSTIFVLFNLPSKDHHNITKILSNIYHYPQHNLFHFNLNTSKCIFPTNFVLSIHHMLQIQPFSSYLIYLQKIITISLKSYQTSTITHSIIYFIST